MAMALVQDAVMAHLDPATTDLPPAFLLRSLLLPAARAIFGRYKGDHAPPPCTLPAQPQGS